MITFLAPKHILSEYRNQSGPEDVSARELPHLLTADEALEHVGFKRFSKFVICMIDEEEHEVMRRMVWTSIMQ
jgi:hypothetical protein